MARHAARRPGKEPDAPDRDTSDAHDPNKVDPKVDPNKVDAEAIARAYGGRDEEAPPPGEPGEETGSEEPVPATRPAKTYAVNAAGEARPAGEPGRADNVVDARPGGEVRAGPGDAGAQDAPRVLDDPRDKPARSFTPIGLGLAAGVVVVLIILLAF